MVMFRITSEKLYIVFLSLLAATPALATDMYLAAIPRIAAQWGEAESTVSLSLVLWFAFYSFFLLVCGPVSDKYGRRPVLLGGLGLFVISSFMCAGAHSVTQLIVFRIMQGISASAPAAMAIAICRDRYSGARRQQALAYIAVILSICPMLAPTLGTFVMNLLSWHYIFIIQGMLTALSLAIALGYRETAAVLASEDLLHTFSRYRIVLTNRRYMLACTVMGMIAGPFFGHIAFAPIVYMGIFGLSDRMFSLIFGLNAMSAMFGSLICGKLARRFSGKSLITVGFVGCAAGSAGVMLLGSLHPALFAGFMIVFSFCCGLSRPASTNIVLEQVDRDIGSASSFSMFYQIISGSLCMWLFSQPWHHPFAVFGITAFSVSALILALWPVLLNMLENRKTASPSLS